MAQSGKEWELEDLYFCLVFVFGFLVGGLGMYVYLPLPEEPAAFTETSVIIQEHVDREVVDYGAVDWSYEQVQEILVFDNEPVSSAELSEYVFLDGEVWVGCGEDCLKKVEASIRKVWTFESAPLVVAQEPDPRCTHLGPAGECLPWWVKP